MQKTNLREIFSIKGVFNVRSVAAMGMLLAITAALSPFELFITPTFKAITFTYLPGVIAAMLFGPWAALVFGFAADTIGFLTNSQGYGYFFGYAISEMVTYFIYACLLYKRPVKIWRVAAARAIWMIFVVFGLQFIWSSIMYGTEPAKYFSGVRLINNLVQFPFHVALTVFVGRTLLSVEPVKKFLTRPSSPAN